ncbi:hypothetical protein KKG71_01060 [Patescibacteria group bacterium]|nr:hypothetical protein [Patescibacteria group bacterium]
MKEKNNPASSEQSLSIDQGGCVERFSANDPILQMYYRDIKGREIKTFAEQNGIIQATTLVSGEVNPELKFKTQNDITIPHDKDIVYLTASEAEMIEEEVTNLCNKKRLQTNRKLYISQEKRLTPIGEEITSFRKKMSSVGSSPYKWDQTEKSPSSSTTNQPEKAENSKTLVFKVGNKKIRIVHADLIFADECTRNGISHLNKCAVFGPKAAYATIKNHESFNPIYFSKITKYETQIDNPQEVEEILKTVFTLNKSLPLNLPTPIKDFGLLISAYIQSTVLGDITRIEFEVCRK